MCDQTSVENLNDTSETESEEWDLIQHKDVQISGNTSDAESVEIISEEEAAQQSATSSPEYIASVNNDSNDSTASSNGNTPPEDTKSDDHTTENNETLSDETQTVGTNAVSLTGYQIFRNFPHSERINSLLSEQRDAFFICLTIFVVGLAMLIVPEDGRFYKTPTSVLNQHEIDIANLLKELQIYRESNDHLKEQVKDLTEVVIGLQKSTYGSKQAKENKKIDDIPPTNDELPPDKNSTEDAEDNFENLIDLINFYKELPFLHDGSIFHHNITNSIKFENSSLNDTFKYYKESYQTTLELFYKIPAHLKQLTTIITQHKNIEPFISKWGNKLNKFSKSMENDIRKMKLKFARHLLKNVNDMMYSFYRRLCKFEINKVITVPECDTFNFTKPSKKNYKDNKSFPSKIPSEKHWKNTKGNVQNNNIGKKYKWNKIERNNRINMNEKEPLVLNKNENENVPVDIVEESKITTEQVEEKSHKNYEDIIGKNRKQFSLKEYKIIIDDKKKPIHKRPENKMKFERNIDTKINLGKSGKDRNKETNSMNYSEYINGRSYQIDSILCKKGYLLRCNSTGKADIDSNWFLDMGNQRSKIRAHQTKGEWLFERARARREKNIHENHRQFYRKHSPPYF